ncbi:MAG TPA: endo-1,4-beta-xylanase [Chitinophagaceae bacterium]|nr:endo-1,4-beta-xylanase [Chitinophagaceae bacterium]
MKQSAFYVLLLAILCIACSKQGSAVTAPPTAPPPVMDTVLYKSLPFKMGASINVNLLKNNTAYSAVVTKEFNSVTPENAMKMGALQPQQNVFNWADADYLVNFAATNGKRVHGHTLNWYNSLPAWVNTFSGDSAAWEQLLKTHIQTVVTHFKGKVSSWDVVNEAFNDDGSIRNSIWVQHLGTDYIARCFQYARQADSAVLLFYNDYGQEYSAAKRNAIYAMVSSFKTRGIPVDGVGLQFHLTYTQTDANIAAAIASAVQTGLKVHIAELDIRLNSDKTKSVLTPELAAQQAARYKTVVKAFASIPAQQQYGITTWNVSDADSWIPAWQGAPDWPLPFDANYKRKPAYGAIIEGSK